MLIIRHKNGNEKRVTDRAYRIMPASVRKDWEIVRRIDESAPSGGAKAKDMKITPSFLPEEIAEVVVSDEHKAKQVAMASSIAGEHVGGAATPPSAVPLAETPKEPVVAASVAQEAPVAAEPPAKEVVEPTKAPEVASTSPVKRDDLASLPNMGAKAAEALNAGGIFTYAQLAEATTPTLNAILEGANFGPKRAQVPQWKSKAAELAKTSK